MGIVQTPRDGNGPERAAISDLAAAEADIEKACRDIESAPEHALEEIDAAERRLAEAKTEIKEEERRERLVNVTVDRVLKEIPAGTYVVSAFKARVGVAPDRELDEIKNGVLEPLADNAAIRNYGHEVFVSHPRTGGSS